MRDIGSGRWEHKQAQLSPTTAQEYARLMERRLRPDLGSRRLDKISVALIDGYYHRLSEEQGLAPSSVRQYHAVLRGDVRRPCPDHRPRPASTPASHATPTGRPPPRTARCSSRGLTAHGRG